MRILILTQWFDPEPTFKGMFFAKALQNAGHEVEVITGFPNYPGGKLYPGYKLKWLQKEIVDGVKITRVPLYPSHDRSAKKRITNYISFAITSTLYGVFGAEKADVIYVYHPPITVGLAGAIVGILRRTPFVYDVQDLWPDTLRASGMLTNRRILSIVNKACNWVYKKASHIVVLSPGFKKKLIEKGVPERKLSVIFNWCDENSLLKDSSKEETMLPRGFNVVFAGNMGPAQALDVVLNAGELLLVSNPQVNLVMVGGGLDVDRLKKEANSRNLSNIHFISRMSIDEIGKVLTEADALLVHLKDDELFSITIPSKTQAYLAKSRPIIMAVKGDAANLVNEAQAGICIEPENPEQLSWAISQLVGMSADARIQLGRNAAEFYQTTLALQVGMKHFLDVFDDVIIRHKEI
jgi:colanic acid biosynthesis glycosyl transferase WcaI